MDNCYSHLTNFSLNKKNENFTDRSKRAKSEVFEQIKNTGTNIQQVQDEIDDIIRFTLISNQPHLAANYRTAINNFDGKSRLFEILGFDILLDCNEVNSMPSLSTGSEFDLRLKTSVIEGTLKIIDLKPSFKRTCVSRTRKAITQRISGVGDSLPLLFSPEKESENAKTTNWRQIYPIENDSIIEKCEIALEKTREAPLGGVSETAASRMRREASFAHANKNSQSSLSLQSVQSTQSEKSSPKLIKLSNNNGIKIQKNDETRSERQASVNARLPVKAPRRIPSINNGMSSPQLLKNQTNQQLPSKDNNNINYNNPTKKPTTATVKNHTAGKYYRRFSIDETKLKNDTNNTNLNASDFKPSFQAVKTPRSVFLANEARKNRMMSLNSQSSEKRGNPFVEIFPCSSNTIIEIQEKERIATLRKREAESLKLNILQKINLLLQTVNSANIANKPKKISFAKRKSVPDCKISNIIMSKSNC